YGHHKLGHLLAISGSFSEATKEFDQAFGIVSKLEAIQPISDIWFYRSRLSLLMDDAPAALDSIQRAMETPESNLGERDIIRNHWLLGVSLQKCSAELSIVANHLSIALTRCRRINMVDHEPDILLAWANWYRAKGDLPEALAHANEALDIADRCEYR